ncbi:MAG: hypothetical protein AB1489_42290 [Acidobacteriota bacterium]
MNGLIVAHLAARYQSARFELETLQSSQLASTSQYQNVDRLQTLMRAQGLVEDLKVEITELLAKMISSNDPAIRRQAYLIRESLHLDEEWLVEGNPDFTSCDPSVSQTTTPNEVVALTENHHREEC